MRNSDQHSEQSFLPDIHFAPSYGWINDPNGLVFHDGIYELYYQHNPDGIEWNRMTWGHARSTDMLHWEEMGDVLFPDENGTMFSGRSDLYLYGGGAQFGSQRRQAVFHPHGAQP